MITHLAKTRAHTPPRTNPDTDCGLGVTMTCQCRFINGNKGHASGGGDDSRGGCVLGGYVGTLCLPFEFAVNLTLL